MGRKEPVSRRWTLAATATALTLTVAGCLGDDGTPAGDTDADEDVDGTDAAEDGGTDDDGASTGDVYVPEEEEPDYDGWFDDVSHFEGTVDERGRNLVFVNLAEDNLFEPPAVMVDPGTTVDWGWAGATGTVTVTHEDDEFDREVGDRGLELTFDDPGVFRYFSEPHRDEGMKGAIVVDE